MFPVKGLSKSSSSESQAVRGLLWGGLPGTGETVTPLAPGGVRSGLQARESSNPAWARVGAAVTPALGLQLCPRLQRSPVRPPQRPALGEAERKSRLFWMPRADLPQGSPSCVTAGCKRCVWFGKAAIEIAVKCVTGKKLAHVSFAISS